MRTHLAKLLQHLAKIASGETAENGQVVKMVTGETGGETAESWQVVKKVTGETSSETAVTGSKSHRSKEAERSARRRAANPEQYRRKHSAYSAKSKRKLKVKKAEAAFLAAAAEQERRTTLIARLMDELAKEDSLAVRSANPREFFRQLE